MPSGWDADLAAALEELEAARQDLLETLSGLPDDALERARRGGWPVRRVLQHIMGGEWSHVRQITQLRGLDVPPAVPTEPPASVPDAVQQLNISRRALLAALDGVDEATLYRLAPVGREEYSVLSVLENAAHHDREHANQIRSIVASG